MPYTSEDYIEDNPTIEAWKARSICEQHSTNFDEYQDDDEIVDTEQFLAWLGVLKFNPY